MGYTLIAAEIHFNFQNCKMSAFASEILIMFMHLLISTHRSFQLHALRITFCMPSSCLLHIHTRAKPIFNCELFVPTTGDNGLKSG